MKFLLVVSAVLAVAAAANVPHKKESRSLFGFMPISIPLFNPTTTRAPAPTTKAAPTTTRAPLTTAKVTSTTRAPTSAAPAPTSAAPAPTTVAPANPPQENPLPADAVEQVMGLLELIPELAARKDEIFTNAPAGPGPLEQTFGSLPEELQNIIKSVLDYLSSLPAGTMPDLFKPMPEITTG